MLTNSSYWVESYPYPWNSGKCYTYNPGFKSKASKWYGMRFGFKIQGSEGMTDDQKENLLNEVDVFLHEPGP